ncbi:hypothetical protein WJ0W_006740 [Paenibacillus melissococcoides]|uniref:Uncharacterized protein n=1 Tax=Paenibacillus melissococcoides TaxID=2912268 RepID=A0ABN8UEK0_9BACL|nr:MULTISPECIES: hypothetical protein [Paenibacillus]MEB9895032.1 hypothetical protein [Bacillus cereus]GIO82271.1 hypothetical protein J6TS7_58810 [Paenibacillus dendritiformis]CAH8249555.1 hypothetical protein WJ0W_006740 [Paenibacillus melissococcoides]CAH8721079.1 hypothetical protein HTL2_006179 [Paenibacillus melissococcoides]
MRYYNIDLTDFYSNKGISHLEEIEVANFTGMGSSYPAEQLPTLDRIVTVHDIPFYLSSGTFDNMELNEQVISVPLQTYIKIHILGAADNGSYSCPLQLKGTNEMQSVHLKLTDWTKASPTYQELIAFQCEGIHSSTQGGLVKGLRSTIWYQVINISGGGDFNQISFVDNPSMHIFAITLEGEAKE